MRGAEEDISVDRAINEWFVATGVQTDRIRSQIVPPMHDKKRSQISTEKWKLIEQF